MRTQSSNLVATIAGVKNDGKSTVATYIMECLNKPSIIIDVAKQFSENTPYRVIARGINELNLYCRNLAYKQAFYKGNLQLIYRPTKEDYVKDIESAMRLINSELKNITILFEEMELYADRYLTKKSPIYQTLYLSRNSGFDVLCVIKEIGDLNKMIKSQTDYFLLGRIKDINAINYFNTRSEKQFETYLKKLNFREFIFTDLADFWKVFTLKKQIIKLIK